MSQRSFDHADAINRVVQVLARSGTYDPSHGDLVIPAEVIALCNEGRTVDFVTDGVGGRYWIHPDTRRRIY